MFSVAFLLLKALAWTMAALFVWAMLTPIAAVIVGASVHSLGTGGAVIAFAVAVALLRVREVQRRA